MMRNRSGARSSPRQPRRTRVASILALWLVMALTLCAPPVRAQVLIPADAIDRAPQLEQTLERGGQLEAQQRWGEALSHYEGAVREFPERRDLWERLARARLHYDLARRYHDTSFLQSLSELSETSALELYGEILTKIQTHYVEPPDWQELAERGLANLLLALQQTSFREQNRLQASPAALSSFASTIQRRMDVTVVKSSRQAQEVAANVARAATEELGLAPVPAILEFACGATNSLDLYSTFLTGGQLEDTFNQIAGNFVGLGIELQTKHQALDIVGVIAGSPADHGGLRAGDRILEIDGRATTAVSTDEAADWLKGKEGSTTELKVQDPEGNSRHIRLVRRRIEVPSLQEARLADAEHGIAYVKLNNFQRSTSRDLEAALRTLHDQGMRTLILDLRGNPGGLLSAAVEIADKFVSSGTIVSTRGRSMHEDFDYRAHATGTWHLPLLVLIDRDTASASEIFASAIRDHRRGTVIGQRSYGKGSVQGIWTLDSAGGGVRLTTARFYSPNGRAISSRGVAPDLIVQTVRRPADEESLDSNDATLQAAVQHARSERHARWETRSP